MGLFTCEGVTRALMREVESTGSRMVGNDLRQWEGRAVGAFACQKNSLALPKDKWDTTLESQTRRYCAEASV